MPRQRKTAATATLKDPGGLALHMRSSVDLPVLSEKKKKKRHKEGKDIGGAILRLGKPEFKHEHTSESATRPIFFRHK